MSEAHLLTHTYQQLGQTYSYFQNRVLTQCDEQPGWLTVTDLCTAEYATLGQVLARVKNHYPSPSTQAPVSLWFGHYAFAFMAIPIACYLTSGRVPHLNPAEVWVRFAGDGDIAGLAWRGRSFYALPTDPAAGHPQCQVVANQEALRLCLRQQLVSHLEFLVKALSACSPLGRAGMWALAADTCANAFVWVARHNQQEAWGAEEAHLLATSASPLQRQRGFIVVEQDEIYYHLVDRVSCCLYYKVEGGGYCSSCPHRPAEERVALIQAWLAQK